MNRTLFPAEIFSSQSQEIFEEATSDIVTKGLYKMMKLNHPPTAMHSVGVAWLNAGMVVDTELSELVEDPVEFVREGLLHDIGKITIDNSILDSPEPLGNNTEIVHRHPWLGFYIFRSFEEDSKVVNNKGARILLSHFAQKNSYPSHDLLEQIFYNFNMDFDLLNNRDFMLTSLGLNIADHFDARYPLKKHIVNSHDYNNRPYTVRAMPIQVEASFLESAIVSELGYVDKETGRLDKRLLELIYYCGEKAVRASKIIDAPNQLTVDDRQLYFDRNKNY